MDTQQPFSVYVIEIDPRWIPRVPHGRKKTTRRLFYVGSTDRPVDERLAGHLTGTRGFDNGAGAVFVAIRRAREADGLPATLMEGEDVHPRADMTERFATREQARAREGELADALIGQDGTWALSDRSRFAGRKRAATGGA